MCREEPKWQPRKVRAGNPDAVSTAKRRAKRLRALCVAKSVARFALARVAKAAKSKVESRPLPSGYQKPARRAPRYREKNPAETFYDSGLSPRASGQRLWP